MIRSQTAMKPGGFPNVMRTKFNLVCATIAAVSTAMVFAETPKNHEPPSGRVLDPDMTVWIKSPREIEDKIKESLRFKYSEDILADGYKIYEASNGATRWIFVVAANGPRGTDFINLYCYEQVRPDRWLLRGYSTLTGNYFPKRPDWELRLKSQGDHINVFFRDTVVYTTRRSNNAPLVICFSGVVRAASSMRNSPRGVFVP